MSEHCNRAFPKAILDTSIEVQHLQREREESCSSPLNAGELCPVLPTKTLGRKQMMGCKLRCLQGLDSYPK